MDTLYYLHIMNVQDKTSENEWHKFMYYVQKLESKMKIEHSFCPVYIHIVVPAWSIMSVPSSPVTMFASSSAKFSSQGPYRLYRLSLCLLAPSSFGSPFSLHSQAHPSCHEE